MTVKLLSGIDERVELRCWFSAIGLEVESVIWNTLPRTSTTQTVFQAGLDANRDGIRESIINHIVRPFKYEEGSVLSGETARDFFGEIWSRYTLKLAMINSHEMLIAGRH